MNPYLFEAYYFYARTCFTQGKREKAARLLKEHADVKVGDQIECFERVEVARTLD